MHNVLYAYATGAGAVGTSLESSDSFFGRCQLCDMYGECNAVAVTVLEVPGCACFDSHVWDICESCQYASNYGCECEVCAYCRSVECARVRLASDAAGLESVKGN